MGPLKLLGIVRLELSLLRSCGLFGTNLRMAGKKDVDGGGREFFCLSFTVRNVKSSQDALPEVLEECSQWMADSIA
jgi:hypothetical protein